LVGTRRRCGRLQRLSTIASFPSAENNETRKETYSVSSLDCISTAYRLRGRSNRDADCCTNGHTGADGYIHTDANGDCHGDLQANVNTHFDSNSDTQTVADCYANAHARADRDAYAFANAHKGSAYSDANRISQVQFRHHCQWPWPSHLHDCQH